MKNTIDPTTEIIKQHKLAHLKALRDGITKAINSDLSFDID